MLCEADFIKISTGFSKEGATFHAVELMKKTVCDKAKVKAAGRNNRGICTGSAEVMKEEKRGSYEIKVFS